MEAANGGGVDLVVVALGSALLGALAGSWLSHASARAVERQQYLRGLYSRWMVHALELLEVTRSYTTGLQVWVVERDEHRGLPGPLKDSLEADWDQLRDKQAAIRLLDAEVRLVLPEDLQARWATLRLLVTPMQLKMPTTYLEDRELARQDLEQWKVEEGEVREAVKKLQDHASRELTDDPLVGPWKARLRRMRSRLRRWLRLPWRRPQSGDDGDQR